MESRNDPDRYLSPREAAKYMKMSLSWLRKQTAAGEIPHIKPCRRVVYDRLDLDEYMSRHKIDTAWRLRDTGRRGV